MRRTIWKYDIRPRERDQAKRLKLPPGAQVVHAGLDPQGIPCIWVRLDPDHGPKWTRTFKVVYTGEPFEEGWKHVRTYMSSGLVFHVLEWLPEQPEPDLY